MEAESRPHRIPEVRGPSADPAQQQGSVLQAGDHGRRGTVAGQVDPDHLVVFARLPSIEPQTRPVWVKPWAITRRGPLPTVSACSVGAGRGPCGGVEGGVAVVMENSDERTDGRR